MIDNEKVGVGIVTCNRKDSFKALFDKVKSCGAVDVIAVVKNKDFDYGDYAPHNLIDGDREQCATILEDVGVGFCKNTCLRMLLEKGCQHLFLVEDDMVIDNLDVFSEFIKTAKHFNLGHLNWNTLPNLAESNQTQVIEDSEGFKLDITRRLCGCFSYFSAEALNDAGLINSKDYVNALEHAEHAYRMGIKGWTTPFNAFASVHGADKMLRNIGEGSSTMDVHSQLYSDRCKAAVQAFNKEYSVYMAYLPHPSLSDVASFLSGRMSSQKHDVHNKQKPRYTVICYIINRYEKVHEILEKDPEAEYLLVTDDPTLTSKTWNVIYDQSLDGMSTFDKCYSIRFNVFKYASADICVYVDASIQVKKPLKPIVDTFESGHYDMCMMPHPLNSTFEAEYRNWVSWRKYPLENVKKFFKLLSDSHYDLKYKGLFQGGFKIVRRGKLNSDFERLSLAFLKYLGDENQIERLDQTVYSFVLNSWFSHIKILPVSEQILRSDYMTLFWHNSNQPNTNAFYDINKPDMKFMFNKEVECMYLLK